MKRFLVATLLGVMMGLATAATPGDKTPKAQTGTVQIAGYDAGTLSGDGGPNPKLVFTNMTGRNAFIVYNGGSATVWCGWKTTITPSTGFPIPAGASLSVDLVANNGGDTSFYCIQAGGQVDQTTPNDVRWIQVK